MKNAVRLSSAFLEYQEICFCEETWPVHFMLSHKWLVWCSSYFYPVKLPCSVMKCFLCWSGHSVSELEGYNWLLVTKVSLNSVSVKPARRMGVLAPAYLVKLQGNVRLWSQGNKHALQVTKYKHSSSNPRLHAGLLYGLILFSFPDGAGKSPWQLTNDTLLHLL